MLKKPTFKKPTFLVFAATIMLAGSLAFAQNPPPRGERRGDVDPEHGERLNQIDRNRDGVIDLEEFKADSARLFQEFDKNNDGVIDETEMLPPPRDENFGGKPDGEGFPPFLRTADKNRDGKITRAEFDEDTPLRFAAPDKKHDGVLTQDEFPPKPPSRREGNHGGNPPNSSMIEFLGAEMRFGDKLVKNAPFSATTVMENTRRLYDGSTVTRQSKGAIYRDTEGRTRREQTLDSIGSFSVSEGQKLIFISDVVGKTQYFVDQNRKTARRMELRGGGNPPDVPRELKDGSAKTESLGTKIIDGISAEGTRTVIEI